MFKRDKHEIEATEALEVPLATHVPTRLSEAKLCVVFPLSLCSALEQVGYSKPERDQHHLRTIPKMFDESSRVATQSLFN